MTGLTSPTGGPPQTQGRPCAPHAAPARPGVYDVGMLVEDPEAGRPVGAAAPAPSTFKLWLQLAGAAALACFDLCSECLNAPQGIQMAAHQAPPSVAERFRAYYRARRDVDGVRA